MSKVQNPKVVAATLACLKEIEGDRPYTRLAAFIALLQAKPDWTDQEIIELQTGVIRHLVAGKTGLAELTGDPLSMSPEMPN